MMTRMKRVGRGIRPMLAFMLLALPGDMEASMPVKILKKIGTFIDSASVSGVDRNYIDAPEKPWQVIAKGSVNQSKLIVGSTRDIFGSHFYIEPEIKTELSQYVGLWAGYRGFGLGYTRKMGGDPGSYFTIGAVGGSYGVNLRIHNFETDRPFFRYHSQTEEEETEEKEFIDLDGPIKVKTLIADGYYLFNGKRFSYSAAYDQSVIQKRSAGSLMVGLMFVKGEIDYANPGNSDLIFFMNDLGRLKVMQGSVGVGYAYNWVPMKGLLVSGMAMPTLTVINRIKAYHYKSNFEEMILDPGFEHITNADELEKWWYENVRLYDPTTTVSNNKPTPNIDARLSMTYNFGTYFVNAYGQLHNFRFNYDDGHSSLNDWFVNISFGIRL